MLGSLPGRHPVQNLRSLQAIESKRDSVAADGSAKSHAPPVESVRRSSHSPRHAIRGVLSSAPGGQIVCVSLALYCWCRWQHAAPRRLSREGRRSWSAALPFLRMIGRRKILRTGHNPGRRNCKTSTCSPIRPTQPAGSATRSARISFARRTISRRSISEARLVARVGRAPRMLYCRDCRRAMDGSLKGAAWRIASALPHAPQRRMPGADEQAFGSARC